MAFVSSPTLTNLAVKLYRGAINGGKLWYATPDTNEGAATSLNYSTGSDAGGNSLRSRFRNFNTGI